MKKILVALLCIALLSMCGCTTPDAPAHTEQPETQASTNAPQQSTDIPETKPHIQPRTDTSGDDAPIEATIEPSGFPTQNTAG